MTDPKFEGKTVPEWIEELMSHDGGARKRAAKLVKETPALLRSVVDQLSDSLRNDALWERVLPAEALVQIGQELDAALATILKAMTEHDSRDVRRTAMGSLMKNGEKAAAAIPTLVDLVKGSARSEFEDVRELAAEALGFVARKTDAAVPALSEALADPSEGLRQVAATALGRIGPRARAAVPALTKALEDTSTSVRDAAKMALKEIQS